MKKYSKYIKLNYVLNSIDDDLTGLGLDKIKKCYKKFKDLQDYNLIEYDNLINHIDDIRDFYKSVGYYFMDINNLSDDEVWNIYKQQVGFVARSLINEPTEKGDIENMEINKDIKNNNIINIDDYILGIVKDIIPYFINKIKKELKKIEPDEPDDDTIDNIDMALDFINELYKDIKDNKITDDTFIKVILNPMGAYQYKIYHK